MRSKMMSTRTRDNEEFSTDLMSGYIEGLTSALLDQDVEGDELTMRDSGCPIGDPNKRYDEEQAMDFFEGFGGYNYEFGEDVSESTRDTSSQRLARDFADDMSPLEAGADDLPYVSE